MNPQPKMFAAMDPYGLGVLEGDDPAVPLIYQYWALNPERNRLSKGLDTPCSSPSS